LFVSDIVVGDGLMIQFKIILGIENRKFKVIKKKNLVVKGKFI